MISYLFIKFKLLARYPITANDLQRVRVTTEAQWNHAATQGCYDVCQQENELAFLSIQEGRCFRNCISKLSFFYPSLNKSLVGSGYQNTEQELEEYRNSKGYFTPNLDIMEF